MNWKPIVRRFLTTTSVPPIAQFYRAGYWLLATVAARRLKRYPGTQALYLSRGLASERIVPGVSDIDFTLFGEWEPHVRRTMVERYERLARWLPVFDPNAMQFLFSPAEVHSMYHNDALWWYRFTQGRQRWKLIHGEDVLAALPQLDDIQQVAGLMLEVKLWWMHFANRTLGPDRPDDALFVNGVCFKAVSEVLAAGVFLDTGRLPGTREQVMRNAGGAVPAHLLACLESRYRHYHGDIVEESWRFLLDELEDWFCRSASHPGNAPVAVTQRLDGTQEETFEASAEQVQIEALLAEARQWPGFRAAHVVTSLSFSLEDLLVLIEVDPTQVPTAGQVARLNRSLLSSRVHLFLLLPHAAYQLSVFHRGKSWQTILCPSFNADVYLQLQRQAPWTQPLARFMRLEQQLLHDAFGGAAIYKTNMLTFLQGFWKSLQLAVVEHSARSGSVVYPTTLAAIIRGLRQQQLETPAWLDDAATAYQQALAGSPQDLGRLLPEAVAYGRRISQWTN